jgi:hypothetical protein
MSLLSNYSSYLVFSVPSSADANVKKGEEISEEVVIKIVWYMP